jgi:hypothetical protein
MKRLFLLFSLVLAGCATPYGQQGLLGGFSDYLNAPDEATIVFHGNGYTSALRVVQMAGLRACDVTLQHGYRYFVLTSASDVSSQGSFTTPGYASTYGSAQAYGFGNFVNVYGTSSTVYNPPQTFNIYKPGVVITIKMANSEAALEPYGLFVDGQKARPRDAAFFGNSLRQ